MSLQCPHLLEELSRARLLAYMTTLFQGRVRRVPGPLWGEMATLGPDRRRGRGPVAMAAVKAFEGRPLVAEAKADTIVVHEPFPGSDAIAHLAWAVCFSADRVSRQPKRYTPVMKFERQPGGSE